MSNLIKVGMSDLEDIVYFFMKAPLDRPGSRRVIVEVLCKLNGCPSGDPMVEADVDAWLAKAKKLPDSR